MLSGRLFLSGHFLILVRHFYDRGDFYQDQARGGTFLKVLATLFQDQYLTFEDICEILININPSLSPIKITFSKITTFKFSAESYFLFSDRATFKLLPLDHFQDRGNHFKILTKYQPLTLYKRLNPLKIKPPPHPFYQKLR